METLKNTAIIASFVACLALCPEMPTPAPYDPTDNPSQRVREFVQGDRATLDEADLHSPNVSEPLRAAAKKLID